jgi:hypothetical protein
VKHGEGERPPERIASEERTCKSAPSWSLTSGEIRLGEKSRSSSESGVKEGIFRVLLGYSKTIGLGIRIEENGKKGRESGGG